MSKVVSDDSGRKEKAKALIAALDEPRKGQVYRHAKGGLYSVVSVSSLESDPETILVTYSSNRLGGDTTRTLAEFNDRFTREAD